jgi:hypothetical protein
MKWHLLTAAQTLRFSGISKAAGAGQSIVWRETATHRCDLSHLPMHQSVKNQFVLDIPRSEDARQCSRDRNRPSSERMTTVSPPNPMVIPPETIAGQVRCAHLPPKRRGHPTRSSAQRDGIGEGDYCISACAILRGPSCRASPMSEAACLRRYMTHEACWRLA